MSDTEAPPPQRQRAAEEPAAAGLVTQHVRHGYWKYPIIALALAVLLGVLGVFAGSPNSPRATIANTSHQDPGGAALAFAQELAGTSASAGNQKEFGLGSPGELFVTGPLSSFVPLLGGKVAAALAQYRAAPVSQQAAWADNYLKRAAQESRWPALGFARPGGVGSGVMAWRLRSGRAGGLCRPGRGQAGAAWVVGG